uniref:Uncharacterized protein n=1 Tax=Oryza glumipatula TaxID=40148 RepID=A0A0D9Y5L4_9ORYZ
MAHGGGGRDDATQGAAASCGEPGRVGDEHSRRAQQPMEPPLAGAEEETTRLHADVGASNGSGLASANAHNAMEDAAAAGDDDEADSGSGGQLFGASRKYPEQSSLLGPLTEGAHWRPGTRRNPISTAAPSAPRVEAELQIGAALAPEDPEVAVQSDAPETSVARVGPVLLREARTPGGPGGSARSFVSPSRGNRSGQPPWPRNRGCSTRLGVLCRGQGQRAGRLAELSGAIRPAPRPRLAGGSGLPGRFEQARLILDELNVRAISTTQALVRAFGSIGVQGPAPPPDDSSVTEKLRWVEKAGKFAVKASAGYRIWCSWATTRMLSLLLRGKGRAHIGPSARAAPSEVTALLASGSGVNSSRKDADDFTWTVPASSSALALASEAGRRELLPTIAAVMAVTPNAAGPSLPAPGIAQPGIRSGVSSSSSFYWETFDEDSDFDAEGWSPLPLGEYDLDLANTAAGLQYTVRCGGARAWLPSVSRDPTPPTTYQVLRRSRPGREFAGASSGGSSRIRRRRRGRSQRDGLLPRGALLARSSQATSLGRPCFFLLYSQNVLCKC